MGVEKVGAVFHRTLRRSCLFVLLERTEPRRYVWLHTASASSALRRQGERIIAAHTRERIPPLPSKRKSGRGYSSALPPPPPFAPGHIFTVHHGALQNRSHFRTTHEALDDAMRVYLRALVVQCIQCLNALLQFLELHQCCPAGVRCVVPMLAPLSIWHEW